MEGSSRGRLPIRAKHQVLTGGQLNAIVEAGIPVDGVVASDCDRCPWLNCSAIGVGNPHKGKQVVREDEFGLLARRQRQDCSVPCHKPDRGVGPSMDSRWCGEDIVGSALGGALVFDDDFEGWHGFGLLKLSCWSCMSCGADIRDVAQV